jgi:hypothetical protein
MARYLPEGDVPSDDKVVIGHSDSTRTIAGPIVTPGMIHFSLSASLVGCPNRHLLCGF